jgi:hypothetical protein
MLPSVRSTVAELLPRIVGKQAVCTAGFSLLQDVFFRTVSSEAQSVRSTSGGSIAAPGRHNNPAYIPWTASSQLQKRKEYKKRMHYLVQVRLTECAASCRTMRDLGRRCRSWRMRTNRKSCRRRAILHSRLEMCWRLGW